MDSYDKNKVYSDVYQGKLNEVTFIDIISWILIHIYLLLIIKNSGNWTFYITNKNILTFICFEKKNILPYFIL